MEHLKQINYLALAASAVVYFLLGAVWYSKLLFAKKWMELSKVDPNAGRDQMPVLFINAFVCGALASFGIAVLISYLGITALPAAIKLGLLCGGCFAFTSLSMSYMFGQRGFTLVIIDSFYHITALTASSVILATWH